MNKKIIIIKKSFLIVSLNRKKWLKKEVLNVSHTVHSGEFTFCRFILTLIISLSLQIYFLAFFSSVVCVMQNCLLYFTNLSS